MVPSKSLNFPRPQFGLDARIHLNNECLVNIKESGAQ